MTKTDYKRIINKLNKKLTEKLELIRKKRDAQEAAKKDIRKMMEADPRKRLIESSAEEYRKEVRENDK